jgi:hypothetical protein
VPKYPRDILELYAILRTKGKLSKKSAEVNQQGELACGQKAEDYLCDHDLMAFDITVVAKVKVVLSLSLMLFGGYGEHEWQLASSAFLLFFRVLLASPYLFALDAGLDTPVPKSAVKFWIKERMGEGGDECR